MNKWKIVNKDGNPEKEGVYWCTLISSEWIDGKATGRKVAEIASRLFGDASNESNLRWKMHDQPDEGLIWTEATGSAMDETVWAWMEMEDIEFPQLPDGVVPAEW